jgi:hypothetical protein
MLYLNIILAFLPALTVWFICSGFLAHFIYRVEMGRPDLGNRVAWWVLETALVFGVFVGSVGVWIGLTCLLQQVTR